MSLRILIIVFVCSITCYGQAPTHNKKVIGYYAQWAIFARDYNVLDIEGDKLTHLMYAFFDATYDEASQIASIESLDTYADFDHNESGLHAWDAPVKGNIGDLQLLKQNYPHLKVLISVGGWTRSQNFPAIAASENARQTFAQSMVDFMNTYPWIDGFDLDWEFPITGGTDGNESINGVVIPAQPHTDEDHKNLVYLLKAIRETFDANNMQDKELSIAMGNNVINAAGQFIGPANQGQYGMSENIMDFCDFVTFFGYDFGGNWYDKTCYNAPLFGGDNPNDPLHNPNGRNQVLDELVDVYLTDVGIPANKLIMGLPFYGKIFDNVASSSTDPNLPGLYVEAPRVTNSCALPQPPQGSWDAVTCEFSGSIEYCDLLQGQATTPHHFLDINAPTSLNSTAVSNGWVRYWDDIAKVPYLYNANQQKFISYDDNQSIAVKVHYTQSKSLGGVMIWELSQDARNTDQGLLDTVDQSLLAQDYSISLMFQEPNDSYIENIEVQLKNEAGELIATQISDEQGTVVFNELPAYRAYTVAYILDGYTFLPNQQEIIADDFGANLQFTVLGSNTVSSVSGTVKEGATNVNNVLVKIVRPSDGEMLASLESTDGFFSFEELIQDQDYNIIAEKAYYSFETLELTDLQSDMTDLLIEGIRDVFTISGIVTSGANPLEGVEITITGNNQNNTTTTDVNGNYVIEELLAGYDYTITPHKEGHTFLPETFEITALNEDKILDFTENVGLIYGTIKNGQTRVSGAIVQLVLPWTDAQHGYQSLEATTNASGEYFFEASLFEGYNTITSIKLQPWQNNNVIYYPEDIGNIPVPEVAVNYNFNSEQVQPVIDIIYPNTDTISLALNDTTTLEANVTLSYDDQTTTLSSIIFEIDDEVITNSLDTASLYQGNWTPDEDDFGSMHVFKVIAEASNGETITETFEFTLNCQGDNCPNVMPNISWELPVNTTINQNEGFEPIIIEVLAEDIDGTISNVSINIDGNNHEMIAVGNHRYRFEFTPSDYVIYPLVVLAEDNEGAQHMFEEQLTITNSSFTPLPDKVIVGYWHSWDNASAPFLYFNEVNTKYNVAVYSFIETVNSDGYTPRLTIPTNKYLGENGVYDPQLLKDDIKTLQDQGIPVLVSIGGQNGHVELHNESQKNTFKQGVIDIIEEYGFDGLDIDFEGGSMNFGAGSLSSFDYVSVSNYPNLKYVIDFIREVDSYFGEGFHITAAPETYYVQVGNAIYSDTAGSFIPVIENIRDILDYIHVQLYNTGSITALDGQAYAQSTPDFIVSMTDMLISGFDVGATGYHFNGLDPEQVAIGIPSCPSAAPAGGYIHPDDAIKALSYLMNGEDYEGRNYTLQNTTHPDLRGMMTWSINWDAASGCANEYEFAEAYYDYFFSDTSTSEVSLDAKVYLQGALEVTDMLMRDDIRAQGLLPVTSPYEDALSALDAVFDVQGNNAIVDWIWVELRDKMNRDQVVYQRSALLQRDGDIVDVDGISTVRFMDALADDYYIVINHRNHLGVITDTALTLSSTPVFLDFTNGTVSLQGNNSQTTIDTVNALWAGDGNSDNRLEYSGTLSETVHMINLIINLSDNIFGIIDYPHYAYHNSDVNMDGFVRFSGQYSDLSTIINNIINHPNNWFQNIDFYFSSQLLNDN